MSNDFWHASVRRGHLAAALLGTLLSVSGCYRASFVDSPTTGAAEHERWTDFFLFGLVGEEEVSTQQFCQGPVARVATGSNLGTAAISVLTIGIYTPRKVYIRCAATPEVSP